METVQADSYGTRRTLESNGTTCTFFSLAEFAARGIGSPTRLPISLRILLENLLRCDDGSPLCRRGIEAVASWEPKSEPDTEIGFTPARVLLQDFTGVPCVVDLAAMRDAMERLGGDPARINPLQQVDLVIDHSVQTDWFAHPKALEQNARFEYKRNRERYAFLKWGAGAFRNFRVVPPDTGICHQVNLEYLARVVQTEETSDGVVAWPDTLVGTDSHTPMVNALGVVGWGVGGIEAEAAMLGQPISMLIPQVVGVRISGRLSAGATATDVVLTMTQMLRKKGVVGKFVEYFGPGVATLGVADRALLSNMSPEYGATIGFFPVDAQTLDYLRFTGRDQAQIALVEAYCRQQGLFREPGMPDPIYSDVVELDLALVEPCIAGPRRPQDRVALSQAKPAFRRALVEFVEAGNTKPSPEAVKSWLEGMEAEPPTASAEDPLRRMVTVQDGGQTYRLTHGCVVIASITSCTNTSNPSVLIAAGLLARNAARRGLRAKPWVKTSLAPGSKVVTDYLTESGLMSDMQTLGFHVVGYGCMTCIGNSGPLPAPVGDAVTQGDLVAVAVLSGNRNFEGRINPLVRANYLASPPLVVAYALAGSMDIDFETQPLGTDAQGKSVMLADVWPTVDEINAAIRESVRSEMFRQRYGDVFAGDDTWRELQAPSGDRYAWDPASTYVKAPPFLEDVPVTPAPLTDIRGARALAVLGHSVTTDHISPAGSIKPTSPAGIYLTGLGVTQAEFNSYGARRGNHEVMMRGTFANIRLRNQLVPGTEGGTTLHMPSGEQMSIYDAAMRYRAEEIPLVIIAGQEYGSGSSRDWAAKGTALLGVRAVIAESYERIHRSNLIGMGVLPLQFEAGQTRETLGLSGTELFDIGGIAESLTPGKALGVRTTAADSSQVTFRVIARIDTPNEVEYFRHGGILPFMLRRLREA